MQTGGSWNDFDLAMTADLSRTDGHDPWIEADGRSRNVGSSASLAPANAQFGWNSADLRFSIAREH